MPKKVETDRPAPVKLMDMPISDFPFKFEMTGYLITAGNYGDSLMFFRQNEAPVSITSKRVIQAVKDNEAAFKGAARATVTIDCEEIKTGKFKGKRAYSLPDLVIHERRLTQGILKVSYDE